MQMEVVPTTRQSSHQAARVLARAFVDDPVTMACFRNYSSARRISALMVDFSAELLLCIRRGYPIQMNDNGNVIAAAVIYPPGAYPLPVLDQWLLLIKSILGNGFYDLRPWMRWLEEVDRVHPKEAHYYLEYIGVEPELQGKAIGSAILRHLVNKADEEQVGCYLENANLRNVQFYQQVGFQIMSEKVIIGVPAWFMWRPPAND